MTTPALAVAAVLACADPTVTDGDTFRCGAERVRLHGIDAPERGEPGWREARDALRRLSRDGLTCQARGRDRYGRAVALCRDARHRDVARDLVRQGWARDWARFSGGAYAGEERRARAAGMGVWAPETR